MTCTSEQGCPIHNDVSGRLWYLQIGIECNIVIITEIYITYAKSVPLSFSFIFIRARHSNRGSAFAKELFIDYFPVHNIARAIDAFYCLFLRTQQSVRHRCAQSVYRTALLVKIGFLSLVRKSLRRALVLSGPAWPHWPRGNFIPL